MRPRRFEVQLRELVLEGVDDRDRDRVLASLRDELARRLVRGEHPRASATSVVAEEPAAPGPVELGVHVARTIAKGGPR
jgi:hypothetical protein